MGWDERRVGGGSVLTHPAPVAINSDNALTIGVGSRQIVPAPSCDSPLVSIGMGGQCSETLSFNWWRCEGASFFQERSSWCSFSVDVVLPHR